jgi:CHAD domain-containing protein
MEEPRENTPAHPAGTAKVLAKKPGIAPPANEWSKVRKLALRHLNRFVSLEAKVLKGDDPGAIHDMRVASRRLQQVLDLIFPKPLPREARRLRRKIRRCRRVLGDLRNCDVLLQQVQGRLARKRCPGREAWRAVEQHLQERRSKSFSRAIRKLSKVNLAVFYMRAKEILERLRPAPEPGPGLHPVVHPDRPALEPFPARLAQALAGVWREFEEQVAASHREKTAPSIHAARIGAKRLRYLLEVASHFGLAGSSNALTWLRKIQQHLGDWHDMEVLEEMIIEMIAQPEFWRDQLPLAMATGKLILRNRTTKLGFREKYFQMTLDSPIYQGIKNWAEGLLAATTLTMADA